MRTFFYWGAGVFFAVLLAVAGCGTPRQTVTVSERPPEPTDTVTSPADTLAAEGDVSATIPVPAGYDTVQVGRFDRGKLWPLDQVPTDYFESAYGVKADSQWLGKAQRAALRFGENCSGSFVSSEGLVMTNHHCARDAISRIGPNGDLLLENGFYADSLGAERTVPNLHVEQLVHIEDVTARVLGKRGASPGGSRQQRVEQLQRVMTKKAKKTDERLRVEIVALYHGAQYSAYTYRRYEDVRLVMAPELQVGYFGGESDNFTYPRFSLDVAFFRVYGEDGTPLRPDHHFSWAAEGAERGDPVFVVGNPGSTSRLEMVSQWTYKREYKLPQRLEVFRHRRNLLQSYIANNPEKATTYGLQNTFFSIGNSIKSLKGQLRGLQDPYLIARRAKALRSLRDTAASVDSLQKHVQAIGQIEQLQESKRILADKRQAFLTFANLELGSRILTRAVHGYFYDFLRERPVRPDRIQDIRNDAEKIANWPDELERTFLTAQLEEIRNAFGTNHPTIRQVFKEQSPEKLAADLVENSALTDSTTFLALLEEGYLKSKDPSVPVIEALAPLFRSTNRRMENIRQTEKNMNRRLSKVRRAVYGSSISPEASFTLRISDGVVKGYPYSGTVAPPFTNFYGLYDRYYSHSREDWGLPDRWITPPDSFDLETPLNLVSTNDISGGSSGSPLLNEDLEIVGVAFDTNMEALPNEYLYRDREARAISVDARGILEALYDMYGATRLVRELTRPRRSDEQVQAASSGPE